MFRLKSFHADGGLSRGTKPIEVMSASGLELGLGLEWMVLRREKSPNWGLIWREKVGLGLGFWGWMVKWAEMTRGELVGEPKRLTPDLRVRERGDDVDLVVVVVGQ